MSDKPMAHRDTQTPKIQKFKYTEKLRIYLAARFADALPEKLSPQDDANATPETGCTY